MKFSSKEVRDLVIAGILLSIAFGILLSGGIQGLSNISQSSTIFIIAFTTAGLGFILHELMHKFVAQKYGLQAEFHASYGMLGLAVLFSFFGFIFAAPGAVFISGLITKERNGKIALAGPITNIILSIIFLILFLSLGKDSLPGIASFYGLSINSLLAAFNMIPAMPFDGAKVIAWSKPVYFATLIISLILFFSTFLM